MPKTIKPSMAKEEPVTQMCPMLGLKPCVGISCYFYAKTASLDGRECLFRQIHFLQLLNQVVAQAEQLDTLRMDRSPLAVGLGYRIAESLISAVHSLGGIADDATTIPGHRDMIDTIRKELYRLLKTFAVP